MLAGSQKDDRGQPARSMELAVGRAAPWLVSCNSRFNLLASRQYHCLEYLPQRLLMKNKTARPQLIVVPEFGLCNRLRVIGFLAVCAKFLERDFKVLWQTNEHCGAEFTDLFEPEPFLISEIDRYDFKLYDFLPLGICLPRRRRRVNFLSRERTLVIRSAWLPDQCFLPARLNTLLHESTWPGTCNFISNLRPTKSLRDVIDSYDLRDSIGIHIRRKDTSAADTTQPWANHFARTTLPMFESSIEKEIRSDANAQFFLSTNSEAVEETFSKKYGDRIFIHKKQTRDRINPQGIQEALVDLLLLASTKRVIGTRHSSFSEVASRMSGADIVYPS